jgi:hypothetical protein
MTTGIQCLAIKNFFGGPSGDALASGERQPRTGIHAERLRPLL